MRCGRAAKEAAVRRDSRRRHALSAARGAAAVDRSQVPKHLDVGSICCTRAHSPPALRRATLHQTAGMASVGVTNCVDLAPILALRPAGLCADSASLRSHTPYPATARSRGRPSARHCVRCAQRGAARGKPLMQQLRPPYCCYVAVGSAATESAAPAHCQKLKRGQQRLRRRVADPPLARIASTIAVS